MTKLTAWKDLSTTRTSSYRFTTTDRNHPAIAALKQEVRINTKCTHYVKLQGRGSRLAAKADGFSRADQSLPLNYAAYYDVYVYQR